MVSSSMVPVESPLHLQIEQQIAANNLQHLQNDDNFQRMHSPCNPFSQYHDLRCNHRIKTPYLENCGAACKNGARGMPFVCPDCVTSQVRLQMVFDGLTLNAGDGDVNMDDTGRVDRIKAIAELQISRLVQIGHRLSVVVPKLDPTLQFFNEFEEAQVDGCFVGDPNNKDEESGRKYKRPGIGSRVAVGKPTGSKLVRSLPFSFQNFRRAGKVVTVGGKAHVQLSRESALLNPTQKEALSIEALLRQDSKINPVKQPQRPKTPRPDANMDDLVDHLGDTKVGEQVEDEASKAVREVLAALTLDKNEDARKQDR